MVLEFLSMQVLESSFAQSSIFAFFQFSKFVSIPLSRLASSSKLLAAHRGDDDRQQEDPSGGQD